MSKKCACCHTKPTRINMRSAIVENPNFNSKRIIREEEMITLKTLSQATEQEVFDQVARHLLDQNACSFRRGYGCQYRCDTLKCAAGCLISDDEYDPGIEGADWMTLACDHKVPPDHKKLIRSLQLIHDQNSPDAWRRKLEDLAATYNLKWNF